MKLVRWKNASLVPALALAALASLLSAGCGGKSASGPTPAASPKNSTTPTTATSTADAYAKSDGVALPLGLTLQEARVQSLQAEPIQLDLRGKTLPAAIDAPPPGILRVIAVTDASSLRIQQGKQKLNAANIEKKGATWTYEFFVINDPAKPQKLMLVK